MNAPLQRTSSGDDRVRADQIAEARRLSESEGVAFNGFQPRRTLTTSRPSRPAPAAKNGPAPLKGHEAFLKALEKSGANVIVQKISSGEDIQGTIAHSDKWTVTMRSTGKDRVIFKHDISEFSTTTPRQAPAASEGQLV